MAWIVVVGAGPAGLMAAAAAVEAGCRVTLIDEAGRPGGQIYRQSAPSLPDHGLGQPGERARKDALFERFAKVAERIDYRANCVAHSLFAGPELHVATDRKSQALRPDAVILATGVCELGVPFPGWTLPGVMFAGGVQAVLKSNLVRPGDRAVVAGTGPLPVVVAAQLLEAGAEVRAVALLQPLRRLAADPLGLWAGREIVVEGRAYLGRLKRAGVPLLQGWAPIEARGAESLESVSLTPVDGAGRPRHDLARCFEADLLGINFGFTANSELARMAGAACRFQGPRGGWVPVTDDRGRTDLHRVYVAGDGAGLRGALVAAAEGEIVGAVAAAECAGAPLPDPSEATRRRRRHQRFQRALVPLFELPAGVWRWADDETTLCRCEGVTRARIDKAIADGHRTLDGIKRNTRAGMGWCGGRICLQSVAALARGGTPAAEMAPMRARPVARPVALGALAAHEEAEDAG